MCAATAGVMNMWPGRAVTFVDSASRGRATAHTRTQRAHMHTATRTRHGAAAHARGTLVRPRFPLLWDGKLCLPMPQHCSLARRSVASTKQTDTRTQPLGICAALPHLGWPSACTFVATWQITTRTAPMMDSALPTCACKGAPPLDLFCCVCGMLCYAGTRWCRPALPKSCKCRSPIHPSS